MLYSRYGSRWLGYAAARTTQRAGDERIVEYITLVPMLACFYAVYRWSTQVALLYVVLPTMLLTPTYYGLTIKPLPAMNFLDAALLALLAGMLAFDCLRWRFRWMDFCVVLFLVSAGYADYHNGKTTQASYSWWSAAIEGLAPYMAGRLLIEQFGHRIRFVRTFLVLIAIGAVISSIEFFFKRNPYASLFNHFYPSQYSFTTTQVRWGFGRVSGPFAQSELAGMVLLAAWLFALWMGRTNFEERASGARPALLLRKGKYWIWGMFVALYMTQARGPWIGAALGAVIAAIGRAKRPRLRALVVIAAIVLIGMPAYSFAKQYVSGTRTNFGSDRETAQYRQELINNYVPVAEEGNAWGWGKDFPVIDGQSSIDNEYLLAWLTQGYVGVGAFLLIIVGSLSRLAVQSLRARSVRELHFYTTMMGIIVGIAFTLTTVFLGAQSYELLFLLVGWVQAIHVLRVKTRMMRSEEINRPETEARCMQVYS